ncbi:efflux RND transporter permease subunit, partial [Bowmanella dokdonensis]
MLGQRRVSTYLDRGQEYYVIMEGNKEDYRSPQSIENLYVRSKRSGLLIPLDNLLTFEEGATSSTLNRYNRMRSITITANLADGYTLGEALTFLNQVVEEEVSDTIAVDYRGES